MIRALTGILCFFIMLCGAAVAKDDDPMEKAIKARQGYMRVVGWNAGPLFAMAKGKQEYDAELAAQLATNLHGAAVMKNPTMWPEGSDNVAYKGKTRTKPEAWTTYPKVAEAHDKWRMATGELMQVAGDGLDALKSKMGAVGKGCKGCHDDFRTKDF